MAYAVGNRVRVADQSSEFRRHTGTVKTVIDSTHFNVRIDGHPCNSLTLLRSDQLKIDATAQKVNYGQCTG